MKRILIVAGGLIVAAMAAAYVLEPQLFTAEGGRARFMRSLESGPLVVRRSCYSMETFVNAEHWAALGQGDRRRAAEVLGAYCRDQGSAGAMTIVDAESRRKLAHWDGSSFTAF